MIGVIVAAVFSVSMAMAKQVYGNHSTAQEQQQPVFDNPLHLQSPFRLNRHIRIILCVRCRAAVKRAEHALITGVPGNA